MEQLNPNKSKLCHLVEVYSPFQLPRISVIDYIQTHRCRGCGIRYDTDRGQVKAFLRMFDGQAKLSIECEEQSYDEIFCPEADILILYGLMTERR